MWYQQLANQQDSVRCSQLDSMDKDSCLDSATGDSGFLSGSNCTSYSCSSEYLHSTSKDAKPAVLDSVKNMDSDVYFGLTNNFNQLSLSSVDTSKEHLESKLESTSTINLEKLKETCNESWKLYYTQNDDGDTLLHHAIIQGFVEATYSIINLTPHPCLFDTLNDESQTALHLAVITNQPDIVRRLVIGSADLSIRNYQGNTALHLACISGNLACAIALTQKLTPIERELLYIWPTLPQNLEQRNYNGETCLHIAASKGHVDLVKLLLESGADLDAQESLAGRTALHLALEHGRLEVVHLVSHLCRGHLETPTYLGCTAYQIARCIDEKLANELLRLSVTTLPEESEFRETPGFALPIARA